MLVKLQLSALPFPSPQGQVVYTSGKRDEQLETFITAHLAAIEEAFSSHRLTFNHIPSLCRQIEDNPTFYAPYADSAASASPESDWLLRFLSTPEHAQQAPPMLVFFCKETADACYGLTLDAWRAQSETDLLQLFADLADDIARLAAADENAHRPRTRYSLRSSAMHDADRDFDDESRQLIAEVYERISRLRDNGVSAALLNTLFHQEETLSPLRIDGDYRLWLTAYGNVEIRMTPLVKAVYLLFISHPEGILFKHLADYRAELRRIYAELRSAALTASEEESISRLTDPTDNSINEKCARIREAFCRQLRPSLADHYVVNGPRGEAKKVSLSRELIVWD